MKAPKKADYPDQQAIAFGGSTALGHLTRIITKVVPRLHKTKTKKEGLEVLIRAIEDDILMASGYESFKARDIIIGEIRRELKVTYEKDRVCVKYRRFKKCARIIKD